MKHHDRYPFAASQDGLAQQILLVCAGRMGYWAENFRFHPTRKWELDFALVDLKIGCEYQGGLFMERRGGHQTVRGMRSDWEKYNEAQLLGWMVLLFGPDETRTGNAAHVVERAIAVRTRQIEAASVSMANDKLQAALTAADSPAKSNIQPLGEGELEIECPHQMRAADCGICSRENTQQRERHHAETPG